jgi:capping protein alpha
LRLQILSDVKKIVGDDLLPDSLAGSIAKTYNARNCKVVKSPDGNPCILTDLAEIDSRTYFDPIKNEAFTVDHLSLSTVAAELPSSYNPSSKEAFRMLLQPAMSKYISEYYISDVAAANVLAKDAALILAIAGEKANLRNFWSGRWSSIWTLTIMDSTASLSGDVKIHVHYFEDGNLQLVSSKQVEPVDIAFKDAADLTTKVVEQIRTTESAIQNGLEGMYNGMNDETLKAMRRVLPITRTLMEWNINSVRMIKQVRK